MSKGIIKNFYSTNGCYSAKLPKSVTPIPNMKSYRTYGVTEEVFENFGQRIAAKNRYERAEYDYYTENRGSLGYVWHTYCYYWLGDKTDGVKTSFVLLDFYAFDEHHYTRLKTKSLTGEQLKKLEAAILKWHLTGKFIISEFDFPIEIEVW